MRIQLMPVVIRPIEEGDLPALTALYNHYVVHTPATFDLAPVSLGQRRAWFDAFAPAGRHRCFVAEIAGAAVGWASSARFRPKAAYESSVEVSIYLAPEAQGRGLGKRLFGSLLDALAEADVHRAYGLITLPNQPSVALHLAMGFVHIGTFDEAGRKFGRFWDVGCYAWRGFGGIPPRDPSREEKPLI